MTDQPWRHGGELVGEVLARHGVSFLFTLCGGHISPILIGAEKVGLRVVDTRHEATAVFAADATARLTGIPGVAVVTAGPGATNTVTAVKNCQIAQTPLLLLGGATATLLQGRGALQDIDHLALMRPHVKWATSVRQVQHIVPTLEKALQKTIDGVPGPVYVELPVDLLYPQETVEKLVAGDKQSSSSPVARVQDWYVRRHLRKLFQGNWQPSAQGAPLADAQAASNRQLARLMDRLRQARHPLLLVGSQAMLTPRNAAQLAQALSRLGIPTFLSGMARGLLGRSKLHIRHRRRHALRDADLVLLAGVPCDFRLNYGRHIPRQSSYVAINRSRLEMRQNRRPDLAIQADPGASLIALADCWQEPPSTWSTWQQTLNASDATRDEEIAAMVDTNPDGVDPIRLCQLINEVAADNAILIGDGGDFVATASYLVRPRGPLRWLDPGPFGTLGVGAGFALGAKLVQPQAEVWILFGDGAFGYSLPEFDTFARHRLPVIGVIGNDGSWAQIARDQVALLGSSLATELVQRDYHRAVEGLGARGLSIATAAEAPAQLALAREIVTAGTPVLVNALIGRSDFRKGSISL
jgi:acetolactate synthase-like protein